VKTAIVALLVVAAVFYGSYLLIDWAWDRDVRNANEHCAQLGATPQYTYRTRYLCVTPDGRVVR
jgi:hypothetical protein